MSNTYDDYDDLDARCAEIRSRHNSTWNDYDRDDIASWHMARMFEDREKRRLAGELPPPPPPAPKRSLVEDLISIGCVYDRAAAEERRRTWKFERALFEIVRDINATTH